MLLGWRESARGVFTLDKFPQCLEVLSKVEFSDTNRHRHGGILGEISRLPDSVCKRANQILSSYEHCQKYDILINPPTIQTAEW